MAKVAAVVRLTAAPGKRGELIATLGALVKAVAGEPGTEVYAMHTERDSPDAVWFYELYADDAAFATHSGSDAMKEVGPKLAGLVAGAFEIHMLEPVAGKGLAL